MFGQMKLAVAFVAAVLAVVAHGQSDPATVVGMQATISKQFLLSYEKVMIAQHFSFAGSTYMNLLSQQQSKASKSAGDDDFEEQDADSFLQVEMQESGATAKSALLASYEMYTGVKRWLHVSIFTAGDIQGAYWTDRALQLQLQGLAGQFPPQMTQFLYMRAFRTQIQTLKFAYQLQTISHLTTWLEDEMDAGRKLAEGYSFDEVVNPDEEEELIREKLFAFQAYNTFAEMDLYTFYIDMYLNSLLASLQNQGSGAAAAGAAAGSASFLETEAEEGNSAQFVSPMLGSFGGSNPQMLIWISFYRVMLQYQAAQAGLTSSMAESLAFKKENDDDPSNDDEAVTQRAFARQSFASYCMFLTQMSQLDMWLGMMGIFQLYGTMNGGHANNAAAAATAANNAAAASQ